MYVYTIYLHLQCMYIVYLWSAIIYWHRLRHHEKPYNSCVDVKVYWSVTQWHWSYGKQRSLFTSLWINNAKSIPLPQWLSDALCVKWLNRRWQMLQAAASHFSERGQCFPPGLCGYTYMTSVNMLISTHDSGKSSLWTGPLKHDEQSTDNGLQSFNKSIMKPVYTRDCPQPYQICLTPPAPPWSSAQWAHQTPPLATC